MGVCLFVRSSRAPETGLDSLLLARCAAVRGTTTRNDPVQATTKPESAVLRVGWSCPFFTNLVSISSREF